MQHICRSIMVVAITLLIIPPLSFVIGIANSNIFLHIYQKAMAANTITMNFSSNSFPLDHVTSVAMIINQNETNFLAYYNPIYGIKIDYPAGWEKIEFGQNNTNNLVAGFVIPSENKPQSEINVSDFILENVMIGVKTIPFASPLPSPSPSGYSNSFSSNALLDKFVSEQISAYKEDLAGFQIVKSNTTAIDNNYAYQVQYTDKDGPATFDTLQVWTMNGNRIYTILFNADPADFPTYLPIIQKMIDSFVIFNNNQIKFKNL